MSLAAFALADRLDTLAQQQLIRQKRISEGGVTPQIRLQGRWLINFSSNDYLGLAAHPELKAQTEAWFKQEGISLGAGASHLVCGHTALHEALEQRLAAYTGYPAALLFNSGFQANLGVQQALVGRHDCVIHDRLNHASLLDGTRLAGAKLVRYPHLDLMQAEKLLQQNATGQTLLASDHIFSMDGTCICPNGLQQLADRYGAAVLLDDAHGFGLHLAPLSPVDIYMATLGKAMGTHGAFVAGSTDLIEYLRHQARTYIFSTASSPLQAAMSLAALELMIKADAARAHLRHLIKMLRQGLQQQGWQLTQSETAIQPILIGDNALALRLSRYLENCGLLVVAIRPPTVPVGTARLRISLSAAHQTNHITQLLTALADFKSRYPVEFQAIEATDD